MFNSCGKDDSTSTLQSTSINKIMPLGASRVEGSRPAFESFRYELWKDLTENNWTFDYIGTQTGAPDIVLFSTLGGNDGLQNLPFDQTISNIKAVIDVLQNANPNVTIIIEQGAPGRSDIMTTELTNYFNLLTQEILTIASEKSTTSSQVIAVDMFTGFTDSLFADDIHYNEVGANFIASRYYAILENILEE
ncbi:MAG: hypothetical protein ACI86M_003057 [Saprospiraceae bacterium]|jgi:hypothetical protein